jgi:hypothetical protein
MQASGCAGVPFCFDYSLIVMISFFAVVTAAVGLIAFLKIRNRRLRRAST